VTLSSLIHEKTVTCPHCWEEITLVLDLSVPDQDYIEDCFVCCRPIQIIFTADAGELTSLTVDSPGG
jgi:hypothetical protein